jgi:SAM-dependent methyltransferase
MKDAYHEFSASHSFLCFFALLSDALNNQGLEKLSEAIADGDCLLLVLSHRRRTARDDFTKVSVRPVVMQQRRAYQFTFHYKDRVTHENLDRSEAAKRVLRFLDDTFEDAALYTPTADHFLRTRPDGSFRCKSGPPTKSAGSSIAHNRAKEYLIPEGVPCPFLIEIGVMTAEGRVKSSMTHKFRQINRFLELVDDIVPSLGTEGKLRIVDFGCGKSYLTFALHHLLTAIHGRTVRIVGLDRKAEVIGHCTAITRRLGCRGLEFRQGDIADYQESGPVDLAVSLHACDTATDDALARALCWKTRVILAVPCCQHELAKKIEGAELAAIARHGILHERFAALATDALRALVLDLCGYTTQVVEFIDLEHTAKNILIRAVRRDRPDPAHRAARLAEYQGLKRLLGIGTPYLERILEPAILAEQEGEPAG